MQTRTYTFGNRTIRVCLPAAEEVRLEWLEHGPDGSAGAAPYWARVWPAAQVLCRFLAADPALYRNRTVLEIGAGLGLPSLLCATEAAAVWCTDLSPQMQPFVQAAAAANGFTHVQVGRFDWNQDTDYPGADLVLMADLGYDPRSLQGLLRCVNHYREQGSQLLVAVPERLASRAFAATLQPMARAQYRDGITEAGTETLVSIYLL